MTPSLPNNYYKKSPPMESLPAEGTIPDLGYLLPQSGRPRRARGAKCPKIGKLLLDAELITHQSLHTALAIGVSMRLPVGRILTAFNKLSEQDVHSALTAQEMIANGILTEQQAVLFLAEAVRCRVPLNDYLSVQEQKTRQAPRLHRRATAQSNPSRSNCNGSIAQCGIGKGKRKSVGRTRIMHVMQTREVLFSVLRSWKETLNRRLLKMTLLQKSVAIILITFSVQTISVAVLFGLLHQSEALADREYHAKEFIGRVNYATCLAAVSSLSSAARALTGDAAYDRIFDESTSRLENELGTLSQLASGAPRQEEAVSQFRNQADLLVDSMSKFRSISDLQSASTVKFISNQHLLDIATRLHDLRGTMLSHERFRWIASPHDLAGARGNLKTFAYVFLAISIIIAFGLIYVFNVGIARRLQVVGDNAERLARNELLHEPLLGMDEIVTVDRAFHGMATELTRAKGELIESEMRVRSMIENMPIGLIAVDLDGKIEFANPKVVEMFMHDHEGLQSRSLITLFPNLNIPDDLLDMGDDINGSHVLPVKEIEAVRSSGEIFPAEISVSTLQLKDQDRKSLLVSVNDVTERHEIDRMKQEFVAMVTHDLRTPLTSIRVVHDMLLRHAFGDLSEKATANLQIAERSVARLLTLVNDLLDFQKLSAGKMEMHFAKTYISDVMGRSVEAVQGFADKHSISIQIPQSTLEMMADEERLIQVLVNLLSNAIKFSPQGKTVRIDLIEEGNWIEIRVADEGRGIPSDRLSDVFEKYKQLEPGDGLEKKGTGLGLPICKAIVDAHGGQIGIVSQPKVGTTVWLRLPTQQPTG